MSANEKQVGGTHYAGAYQHWDLVVDLEVPYLEAQIIKYTERHSLKNGRQDLEKAIHFAEKLRECASAGKVKPFSKRAAAYLSAQPLFEYFASRKHLAGREKSVVMNALTWDSVKDIEEFIGTLRLVADQTYPREEGAAP